MLFTDHKEVNLEISIKYSSPAVDVDNGSVVMDADIDDGVVVMVIDWDVYPTNVITIRMSFRTPAL